MVEEKVRSYLDMIDKIKELKEKIEKEKIRAHTKLVSAIHFVLSYWERTFPGKEFFFHYWADEELGSRRYKFNGKLYQIKGKETKEIILEEQDIVTLRRMWRGIKNDLQSEIQTLEDDYEYFNKTANLDFD